MLLRGLPFQAEVEDIKLFFNSIDIPKNRIDMIRTFDNKMTGLAFVELRNEEEVKVALLMDHNHIGDRYIDVMRITEQKVAQLHKAANNGLSRTELHRMCSSFDHRSHENFGRRGGGGRGGGRAWSDGGAGNFHGRSPRFRSRSRSRSPHFRNPHGRFAYISGFPYGILYKGVRAFFEGCLIGKGCVHLFRDDRNKFRGDGYIEFANPDEFRKALERNGERFEGCSISIEPCSEREVLDNINSMGPRREKDRFEEDNRRDNRRWKDERAREERRVGGDRDFRGRDDFRGQRGGRRGHDFESFSDDDRGYDGTGGRHNSSPFDRQDRLGGYHDRPHSRGRAENRDPYDTQYDTTNPSSSRHGDILREIDDGEDLFTSNHRSSGGNVDYGGGHTNSRPSSGTSSTKERTLRVAGMSPSTTISDIVAFFKNYGVEYESVRVQCFEDGSPNGKAFVTFPSERLASAALHDLNRRSLKGDFVELQSVI